MLTNNYSQFFATVPKGMVAALLSELTTLGAETVREQPAGVEFTGNLEIAYRVCLWSRIAGRVLLPLLNFKVDSEESLYFNTQKINWLEHFTENQTFAVDFTGTSEVIRHTQFGAFKIKDAIVDQFRQINGHRPTVDTEHPNLRINAYLHHDQLVLSLDLAGESLHRRGYRVETVAAPLKEHLAAAILVRSGWLEIAKQGGTLVDPMCGSGTLLIEAALMAADIAPGLQRHNYGFLAWRQHDSLLWNNLRSDAELRRVNGLAKLPPIYGYDHDLKAIHATQANVTAAGLADYIHVSRKNLVELNAPKTHAGLLIANPPYGERLSDEQELTTLYRQLGKCLKEHFIGWRAAIFTGNPESAKQLGIRAHHTHNMFNGGLTCKLLRFEIDASRYMKRDNYAVPLGAGAAMFANRLRKNFKELSAWAKTQQIDCYRLYDADMPEYNLAIDLYQGAALWVNVQEYQAPKTVDAQKAQHRLKEALTVIVQELNIPREQLFFKTRQRQKGNTQYEKLHDSQQFYEIKENGLRFLVNFTDYLDTGIFLDQRITRQQLKELARGRDFLNLFAYTGTATVYAAAGGAKSTTTIDISNTYLKWAKQNLMLNNFRERAHNFIQTDCLHWLAEQANINQKRHYNLIFIDPPTFSNSKRMGGQVLDIQRDHSTLLNHAIKLLTADGILIFSNNFRYFRLDQSALSEVTIQDITASTVPHDYARNPRIHNSWIITKKPIN